MRSAHRFLLTALALSVLLVTPLGTAWASSSTAAAGDFRTTAWKTLPKDVTAPETTLAAETSYCIPVAGPGVKMTFYCDLKEPNTLFVYCEGVTVEIRMNTGRWAPSGSCPGYRGYRLVPRV
ncbi:hypothetical protein GCM10009677_08160 [Sphaerisporangium rubeum]|uniref:Subtilisin inhibitor domain-containing protein n=1 Tax=Sphaerisporangium rubeum TaxID=321317 RepID=A0A7X0IIV5_9ACTN|nr:hypothetical protein [Sphaerisporangium rubeum]MBB6475464.1 hypothetical protein [Sphaerisporangium rubeum]